MAAAAILKNRKINIYLGGNLTDFDQIWHGEAVQPSLAVRPLKSFKY